MSAVDTILKYEAINRKAKEWEHEGFKVKANIGGWDHPDVVEGLLPDIRGKRDRAIRIGFVDFDESYGENKASMDRLITCLKNNRET